MRPAAVPATAAASTRFPRDRRTTEDPLASCVLWAAALDRALGGLRPSTFDERSQQDVWSLHDSVITNIAYGHSVVYGEQKGGRGAVVHSVSIAIVWAIQRGGGIHGDV